jgi:hypothetical protein
MIGADSPHINLGGIPPAIDIKKGAVKRSDIANNAVNSAKVANNSLALPPPASRSSPDRRNPGIVGHTCEEFAKTRTSDG